MSEDNFNQMVKKFCKKNRDEFKQIHDLMPDRTFRMLIVGPSGSGKTHLLVRMLWNMLYYDKVYLFARNQDQDAYIALQNYFDEFLKTMKLSPKQQKELGKEHLELNDIFEMFYDPLALSQIPEDKSQKVIVFDDMVCDRSLVPIFKEYFMSGRHKNCSVIFLSQSYVETKKRIRENLSHLLVFKHKPRDLDEISRRYGLDKYRLRGAFEKDFDFVYMDLVRDKFMKCFSGETI